MHYIILDIEAVFSTLEINDFREIIELSAYKLNEDLEIVSNFQSYIKPLFHNKIPKKIKTLTGLDYEIVSQGDYFYEAIDYFKEWAGPDVTFISWGGSDLKMIESNSSKHCLSTGWFTQNYHDLQRTYDRQQKKMQSTGLKDALIESDLTFVGQQHCALDDSFNTALLMKKMIQHHQHHIRRFS